MASARGTNSSTVDWASLNDAIGIDLDSAHCALALIIGEDNLRAAVDTYLTFQGGWVVAESVVSHLGSEAAHDRCLEILRTDPDVERRRAALEILPGVVRIDDLPVIGEILSDPDPLIPWHGIRCVKLAYGDDLGEHDSERYLRHLS